MQNSGNTCSIQTVFLMCAAHRNKPSRVHIHHLDGCLLCQGPRCIGISRKQRCLQQRGAADRSGKLVQQKAGSPEGVGMNGAGYLARHQEGGSILCAPFCHSRKPRVIVGSSLGSKCLECCYVPFFFSQLDFAVKAVVQISHLDHKTTTPLRAPALGRLCHFLCYPLISPQLQYCPCWPFGSSELSVLSAGFMGHREQKYPRTALTAQVLFLLPVDFG